MAELHSQRTIRQEMIRETAGNRVSVRGLRAKKKGREMQAVPSGYCQPCYPHKTPRATEWILSTSLSLRDGIRMGILAPITT